MKKQALAILAVICLSTAALAQTARFSDPFESGIQRSQIVQDTLLAKVFRGIEFRKEVIGTLLPTVRIVAFAGGQRRLMPWDFNVIYGMVADHSSASLDERVEAFALLAYWYQDPDLQIVSLEKVQIEREGYTISYRVLVSLRPGKMYDKNVEMLIALKRNQIFLAEANDDYDKNFPDCSHFD